MNKIAIVVSIYKNVLPSQLEEMLNSLYKQTLQGDIFIKVDGTIPPKIRDILDRHKESIAYIDYREENRGIAVSYNELFEEILKRDYEYIVRMDADDIMMPNRLELQYNFMEQNKEIDVVGGYIEEFGDGFEYKKIVQYPLTHNEMFAFFAKRVPLANVTTFFRRSFFEKAGLYPTTSPTNEDTLLWMNGFKSGCRFANIPEVLVKVRVNKAFFGRRGGFAKAWSDFKDRVQVIRTLGYNKRTYFYALALFLVNIAPPKIKEFLYKRLR